MTTAPTEPLTGIPDTELETRRERLLELVRGRGLTGYVVFDEHYIRYFAGLWFLSTERPVVFAQSADGSAVVFVPEFEVERVRAETSFETRRVVPRVPGHSSTRWRSSRACSTALGIGGTIGADQDGYPGILGYHGPTLERGDGRVRHVACGGARGDAGAQERGRDRADPAERALVRACPPAAAGLHATRRHGGRGEPPRGTRGDARAARGGR